MLVYVPYKATGSSTFALLRHRGRLGHHIRSKSTQCVNLSRIENDILYSTSRNDPSAEIRQLPRKDTITWRVRAATELDRQRQKDSERSRPQLSLTVVTRKDSELILECTTAHRLHTNSAYHPQIRQRIKSRRDKNPVILDEVTHWPPLGSTVYM